MTYTSDLPKPDWTSTGWDEPTQEVPVLKTTTYESRRSTGTIVTIVGLAVALVLTLGLAIYATLDMQRDIDDARALVNQQEGQLADLDQQVTEAVADRDLAEEALSQTQWVAEQCHVAADAATSLSLGYQALADGEDAWVWIEDTETILNNAGYNNIGEAWAACDGTI